MKIAVVGSGVSGLTAAHLLSRDHEVSVFEAADRLGGHTITVPVSHEGGERVVDMGFIVFNEANYPNFCRLMKRIGVDSQPSDMSFSVSCQKTGLEYRATDLDTLYAQRRNLLSPSFHRMVYDILRFQKHTRLWLEKNESNEVTLSEYLGEGAYSKRFIDQFIVPMGAAIWSAGTNQMRDFPANNFIRFFEMHGFLDPSRTHQWRTIRGGSSSYIAPLIEPFRERIYRSTPVRSVSRDADGVMLSTESSRQRFDKLVLAVHSPQAIRILAEPSPVEREVLSAIPYQPNRTVLHTDTSLLPKRRKAWASWNYAIPREPTDAVTMTYYSNRLQAIPSPPHYLVSLNSGNRIAPSTILKELDLEHPVFTAAGLKAQQRHEEINGKNHTYYCGAYWGYGFHEDGVSSAIRAVQSLGIDW